MQYKSLDEWCRENNKTHILQQWHPTKNGNKTPADVPYGSGKKAWWMCEHSHEWEAVIRKRTNYHQGCPVCANKTVVTGFNDLATTHPQLVQYWHATRNGDLRPEHVYAFSAKKIWFKCELGHEWETALKDFVGAEQKCPYCAGRLAWAGYNDLCTTHPEVASRWDYKRNTSLPTQIRMSSRQTVHWICEHGHRWKKAVVTQVEHNICPVCANRRLEAGFNDIATMRPDLAAEWHPTKNDFIRPQDILINSKKKFWWLCQHGHEWESSVDTRLRCGCPVCSNHKLVVGVNDLASQRPDIAHDWDYDKNDCTPQEVTVGADKKVYWRCKRGHERFASVALRIKSDGCPICRRTNHISLQEYIIHYFLKPYGQVIHNYQELGYELDIYIPEKKIAIEYDGSYFHANSTKKDLAKNKKCVHDGVVLYRLRESPLPFLNDTSIEIAVKPTHAALESAIQELIYRIYQKQSNINIADHLGEIYSMRDYLERANSLQETHPNIAAQWHPTKNGALTPLDITKGCNCKVWWQCEHGHEWLAQINARQRTGCPYCSNKKVLSGYNDLATTCPEIAAEWHPIKNGDWTPQNVTAGSNKKAWWLGKCEHEWCSSIGGRTGPYKIGCPVCQNLLLVPGLNDLASQHPELAIEWHPTKNRSLTPEQVVPGSPKRVWWQCKTCGHEWQTAVRKRAGQDKTGCPKCKKLHLIRGINDLQTLCPEIAARWHPTKNGALTPSDVIFKEYRSVWWLYPNGKERYCVVKNVVRNFYHTLAVEKLHALAESYRNQIQANK